VVTDASGTFNETVQQAVWGPYGCCRYRNLMNRYSAFTAK